MTLQDIFDRVWDHYIVEKQPAGVRPSSTNNGSTRWVPYYASANAVRRDPVSLFDPDGLLAGKYGSFEIVIEDWPEIVEEITKQFPLRGISLLTELQTAHDLTVLRHGIDKEFHPHLEEALKGVARYFNLKTGVVQ